MKIMNETRIIRTEICDAFTIQLRSDGIVHSHTSSAVDFNVESLKKFTIVMGEMLQQNTAPLLITLDEMAIPPSATLVFWAKKESCVYSIADAYVSSNFGHKIIGNFYLKVNKPGRPSKIFPNKDEAIVWLKTFL